MTVKQLRQQLEKFPDHMEVYIHRTTDDFGYSPLETVENKKIPFSEEPGGKALSKEEVIILSEEF
jgi:hypothetical protein